MQSNATPAEKPADRLEARAQEYAHDAHYIGTDGEGAMHYWSIYHQLVVVFDSPDDRDPALVAIPTHERETGTDITDLGEWCDYVADQRGAWDELLVASSLGDQAAAVIDA